MVSARHFAIASLALFTLGGASCGFVAGLPSDYELASDGGATSDGAITFDAADATSAYDGSSADAIAVDVVDASDVGAGDAAPSVDAKAAKVPPSDPANVDCAASKCAVPTRACCVSSTQASCIDSNGGSCQGLIARCDEAANCSAGDVCCVTDISAYGLETTCHQSCSGSEPHSCRKNAECPNGETCVAWTCNGHVVATCDARGADAACN